MKQFESNPLRQGLERSQRFESHPDADMLTAFAEGAILPREREEILSHLAACPQCREVLSVAAVSVPLPVSERRPKETPRPIHPPMPSWLPWVAIAAGIVVVCSAVLLHQPKRLLPQAPSTESAKLTERENVPLPAITSQESPPSLPPARKSKREKPATGSPGVSSIKSADKSIAAPSSLGVTSDDVAADRDSILGGVAGQENPNHENSSQSARATSAPVSRSIAPAPPASAAGQEARRAESKAAFAGATGLQNMYGALNAHAERPHWRINDKGELERSFGDGPWQVVFSSATSKLRVVSVIANEVWIGGENLQIYHSTDNGGTWNAVQLPEKNGRGSAITHIRFQTAQEGAIDSEDGSSWTTADGGQTWK